MYQNVKQKATLNAFRIVCFFLATFCLSVSLLPSQTITGIITDSATAEPLRFVTVQAVGTKKTAITTKDGRFLLKLTGYQDSVTLRCSLVGYSPTTVRVRATDSAIAIILVEQPFRAAEVVITAEDPAVKIMRKVLARKKAQNDTLERYTYMLYSKLTVITDTATASRSSGRGDSTVFSIMETFSKGYVRRPDRFFNEIIQRRQTLNIPSQANFVSFGTNLNAYDDVVTILGEEVQTPFHPDALDFYDMALKSSEEDDIVRIDVRPRGIARKTFEGTIYIDQRTSAPVEVRLTPNKNVIIPFDATLNYRQTFAIDDGAVVPQALSLTSSMQVDILYVFSPRLDISVETFCYDYNINESFSNDVFDQRRVEIAEQAYRYDSTYWKTNEKMPLRPEELQAYDEIRKTIESPDSVITTSVIDRYIAPVTRTLAMLARKPFTGFDDIIRYNRVHGLYLGLGLRHRLDTTWEVRGSAGYGFTDQRAYGTLSSTYYFGPRQTWSIDATAYSTLKRRDDPYAVRTGLITFTTAMFGNDYGDYFYADGWEAGIKVGTGQLRMVLNDEWERPTTVRLFVRSEQQRSAVFHDTWSLFSPHLPRRDLPPITPGQLRSAGVDLNVQYNPWRMISRTGFRLSTELSDPKILASDFSFFRVQAAMSLRIRTLPLWMLDLTASGGYTMGDVPPQKYFSLESSVSGLAAQGAFRGTGVKEFYGDRYAALSISHNFGEVIPGLLRIPDIASFGIEFILTGSLGWSAFRTPPTNGYPYQTTQQTREQVYYELGVGINRILLFLRVDVTARVSQRLQPQFFLTLSVATF